MNQEKMAIPNNANPAVSRILPLRAITNNSVQSINGTIQAHTIIPGSASGELITSNVALSFWGGINPQTGTVIDSHHPLVGQSITGKILAIPGSRGSCSGSGVILELLLNGCAPAALVFGREEMILTIGVLVAEEMFQRSIPVLQVPMAVLEPLARLDRVRIHDGRIQWGKQPSSLESIPRGIPQQPDNPIELTPLDNELLNGTHGKAAQIAIRILLRTAQIHHITTLIDVSQAHIDCCIYTGPATLHFAQKLRQWNAKVRIPTTLNAISIDQRLWRTQGVNPSLGQPSEHLAQAYLDMGAKPTFTCAPYQLDSAPGPGENVIWGESNAVVFANSVLGARTIKCPDYLDVCAALTGRALNMGSHLAENRKARVEIHLVPVAGADESLFPLLGYIVGDIAAERVPIITGLEREDVTMDDLKAFGAAFATTSSAPMFHIAGVTIEARSPADIASHLEGTCRETITKADLARQWTRFNKTEKNESTTKIDLISLGNPHFSHDELTKLLHLIYNRTKSKQTTLVVTCNRDTYSCAAKANQITALEDFGVQIVTDTCWCMIQEPVIPPSTRTIMTNSAKYAHYGTGLTGRRVRFGSLAQCVDAACLGVVENGVPAWLGG